MIFFSKAISKRHGTSVRTFLLLNLNCNQLKKPELSFLNKTVEFERYSSANWTPGERGRRGRERWQALALGCCSHHMCFKRPALHFQVKHQHLNTIWVKTPILFHRGWWLEQKRLRGSPRALLTLHVQGLFYSQALFQVLQNPRGSAGSHPKAGRQHFRLPWPGSNTLQAQSRFHTSPCPRQCQQLGLLCTAKWNDQGTSAAPHLQCHTLAGLLPTMETFSIALLLVPLMQRLCRQPECQQNDGPAFIYLRLLMEGGQNALWPQSKRLIDCHYWRLSVNRAVTKKWFQCYYTNLRTHFPARQPGSLKQKEFCCRGTW